MMFHVTTGALAAVMLPKHLAKNKEKCTVICHSELLGLQMRLWQNDVSS